MLGIVFSMDILLVLLLWKWVRKISSLQKSMKALSDRHSQLLTDHNQLKNMREQGNARFEFFRKNFPKGMDPEDWLRVLRLVTRSILKNAPQLFEADKEIGMRINIIDKRIQWLNDFLKNSIDENPCHGLEKEGEKLLVQMEKRSKKKGYLRQSKRPGGEL